MEDALRGVNSWTQYKENIKQLYTNETKNNLGQLFAHWYMDKGAFVKLAQDAFNINLNSQGPQNDSEAVIESWASGVEWKFAQERYQNKFGNDDYEYSGNGQTKNIPEHVTDEAHLIYTSITIDMIDNHDQNTESVFRPIDNVSGISIQQVEQGLKGARSWNAWRDNMKSIVSSQSEEFHQLFANWY